mmetsp:Transcript_52036/g.111282  ORF Transcript_52036/g.111282 Transcript_52036/m.111282 type:complete len:183 (-) Transcript_52036:154-702(-)
MRALLLVAILPVASCLRLGLIAAVSARRRVAATPVMGFFDQFTENLKQMADQRVGRASHIMLRSSEGVLTQLKMWKRDIDDDEVAFAERAMLSSVCRSAPKGGDLGFVTRGKLTKEFDDVIFEKEPGYVYGPVTTQFGYHLIYLHSCREPRGATGLSSVDAGGRIGNAINQLKNYVPKGSGN